MEEFELDFGKFCDRIQYLANVFTSSDILAEYLGEDKIEVAKWANSVTLINPLVRIDYACLLSHFPEFNPQWLEKGIGNIYKNGTNEENEAKIKKQITGRFY